MHGFVALATVADPGGAEAITVALAEAGIEARTDRVAMEHPYQASALVSLRIMVPASQLEQAAGVLKALELDVAREFSAQAGGEASPSDDDEANSSLRATAARRQSFATVWLGFLVPVPITCWCVGARLPGTVFLGAFVGTLVNTIMYEQGTAPGVLAWTLAGTKLGDLVVAIGVLAWRRLSPSRS